MCRYDRRAESAPRSIFYTTAAAILILLCSGVLRAQDSTTQGMRDARRNEREARQRDLWELERLKTRRAKAPAKPRLELQQIREDFEQLQLVNYNLSGATVSNSPLNYGQIKKDAAEIKKRAARLKTNLALPEPEKDEKAKKNQEELRVEDLKPAISALDALVQSFVWNRIFQQPDVVNMEDSMKARKDLEGAIILSERIHKLADALSKASSKN